MLVFPPIDEDDKYIILPYFWILMLVPLNMPEQSRELQEVVGTKKVGQWQILCMRLVMALIFLSIMIGLFAIIMIWNNCDFPYIAYVAGTTISAITLGIIGLFVAIISNSAVIGYLMSMGYFLFNLLGSISSENILFLFSMSTGNFKAKVWLSCVSVLLIAMSVLYKKRKKKGEMLGEM